MWQDLFLGSSCPSGKSPQSLWCLLILSRDSGDSVSWQRMPLSDYAYATTDLGLLFFASITKTCLYNFDPRKPYFYIVKLGFTGVYIIFLIFAQNIDCGCSLESPRRGGSNEYPQSMFCAKIWKIPDFFYLQNSSFWRWTFLYIWIGVFS